jgi:hypothetical protein
MRRVLLFAPSLFLTEDAQGVRMLFIAAVCSKVTSLQFLCNILPGISV